MARMQFSRYKKQFRAEVEEYALKAYDDMMAERDATGYIPGAPCKCDELIFLITSKVVMIEPSYWML